MQKFLFLTIIFFVAVLIFSCNKTTSDPVPAPTNPVTNPVNSQEFVATDKDFEGFRKWSKVAEFSQAVGAEGLAHGNGKRVVWIKQEKASRQSTNNQYSVGTIVVKEVQNYGIVGMVKRGGTFNAEHQNWEWFYLTEEGKITSRNASNTCNNCHIKAKNLDYVFSKP